MKRPHHHAALFASVTELAALAVVLLISGCGTDQDRFVGTWTSTILPDRLLANEASPLDIARSERPSDVGGEPKPAIGGDYSIQLRFYRTGQLDTVTKLPMIQTHKTGQWRLLSFDEASRKATIECELMQQRTQHQVEFIDSRTIRLVPPNLAGLKLTLEFKKNP